VNCRGQLAELDALEAGADDLGVPRRRAGTRAERAAEAASAAGLPPPLLGIHIHPDLEVRYDTEQGGGGGGVKKEPQKK
jgi:hypothetical protein